MNRTLRRLLARSRGLLVVITCALLTACHAPLECGPGTHAEAGLCVVGDPSGVGSSPDGGSALIRPGDFLRAVSWQGTSLVLSPFTQSCLVLSVQHADGTSSPLGRGTATIEILSANPALVTAADASECTQAGVVALAPGATSVTVNVGAQGTALAAHLAVTVRDYSLALRSEPVGFVAVGAPASGYRRTFYGGYGVLPGDEPLGFDFRLLDAAGVAHFLSSDVWPASRFLRLTVADTSLATAQPIVTDGYGRWLLQGLAPGQTTLTLSFSAPGRSTDSVTLPLVVSAFSPSALTASSLLVRFADADGAPILDGTLVPDGTCAVPTLLGTVNPGAPALPYAVLLPDGVTWTTTPRGTATVSPGSRPNESCVHPNGIVAVRGCLGPQVCGTGELSVLDPVALTGASLAARSRTNSPVAGYLQNPSGGPYEVCLPLEASLVFPSGPTVDVTHQASWQFTDPQGNVQPNVFLSVSPTGDSICFVMMSSSPGGKLQGYLGTGQTAMGVIASFPVGDGSWLRSPVAPVLLAGTLQQL